MRDHKTDEGVFVKDRSNHLTCFNGQILTFQETIETIETNENRLPRRTEEIEYITIDDEELEPVNSFFEEVNRDYHRREQPRQEVDGNSQDDWTLGVITIEEVDRRMRS